jgi:hypothetical protein
MHMVRISQDDTLKAKVPFEPREASNPNNNLKVDLEVVDSVSVLQETLPTVALPL